MLQIISSITLFLIAITGVAKIEFNEFEKDFGKIREGKVINVRYEFENKGEVPLIIKEVQSSCGCTAVAYPTYPVKAGEKDFVSVKFMSEGKSGFQDKEIRIISNDPRGVIKLKLTGEVLNR